MHRAHYYDLLLSISLIIIGSRQNTPIDLTSKASSLGSAFAAPSRLSLPNAFSRIIAGKGKMQEVLHRDTCNCLELIYNTNYNPYKKPPKERPGGYSPYVYREPLWDDRAVVVARLLRGYIIAGPAKKKRTQWVWSLSYALSKTIDPRQKLATFWACKHCKFRVFCYANKLT